ncbi:MAG: hypothetical protein GTN80_05130 [Nitrososphaeria archaeon]|nr:hypothetical protein [Nitrososphaeria archaeon]NIQ33009.1 hypothetical protein [Nitrososphaeria archaeon]
MNIKEWQAEITKWAISQGFDWKPEDIDTMLLRIVSEVAEASECARDEDFSHLGEELADIFIRLVNCAEVMGIDLEKEVEIKHKKNLLRPRLHGRARK